MYKFNAPISAMAGLWNVEPEVLAGYELIALWAALSSWWLTPRLTA
jgi:hypothetical protein